MIDADMKNTDRDLVSQLEALERLRRIDEQIRACLQRKDQVCDFCSSRYPRWCYPAATFDAQADGNLLGVSNGDWLACEECRRLIEADDRVGLAERAIAIPSIQQNVVQDGAGREAALSWALGMHEQFFDNRTGKARRIAN